MLHFLTSIQNFVLGFQILLLLPDHLQKVLVLLVYLLLYQNYIFSVFRYEII